MARILVIDDDTDMRFSIKAILDSKGHQSVLASDGREGLDCLRDEEFDLVVLDIFMPETDGLNVLSQLNSTQPFHKPSVIAISGGGEKMSGDLGLTAARAFGACATLYKPFSRDELLTVIQESLH